MKSNIQKYEQLFTKNPNSQIFATLANAYRKKGLIDKAMLVASEGLKRHPHFAAGHLILGRVFREQEKTDLASDCFKRAVKLEPANLLALQLLAQCHLEKNQSNKAIKYFQRILEIYPEHPKARLAIKKLKKLAEDTKISKEDLDMLSMTQTRRISLPPLPIEEPPSEGLTKKLTTSSKINYLKKIKKQINERRYKEPNLN